jgi:hypothetical protein
MALASLEYFLTFAVAAYLRARGKNAQVLSGQLKAHIALVFHIQGVFLLTDQNTAGNWHIDIRHLKNKSR